MQSIPDYEARKKFLFENAESILKYNPFDEKGEFVVDKFQDLIGLGVSYGMVESAKDGRNIMDDQTVDQLAKILSLGDLRKVQEFRLNMRNNTYSIINTLSKGISS